MSFTFTTLGLLRLLIDLNIMFQKDMYYHLIFNITYNVAHTEVCGFHHFYRIWL